MLLSHVDDIVAVARSDGIGIRVVQVPDDVPAGVIRQAEQALLSLGFVTMPVVEDRSTAVRASLAHRHVALVCRPNDPTVTAAWWIRWLARMSTRAHLLVLVGHVALRWAGAARPAAVRERIADYKAGPTREIRSVWLRRAESCRRRHRFAAAHRWFQAALAAAERRGDQEMAARAGERLVELLADQGDAAAAWRLASEIGERLDAWLPRASLLSAGSTALLGAGELDRVEAVLAALDAEALLLAESPLAIVDALRAELDFWRGRFGRVRHPDLAATPDEVGWSGMAAWARGDEATLESALAALGRGSPPPFWIEALRALARRSPDTLVHQHETHRRRSALLTAIAAEVLLADGRFEEALEQLAGACPAERSPEGWLHAWLRSRCVASGERTPRLVGRIRREGLDGVLRWGEGKGGMHLIHGLPALLQLVQDADDEQAALGGGCGWLRRHAGADEVAIVEAGGSDMLASDGWVGPVSRDDRTLAVPVRYGRVVVGHLLARAQGAARPGVEQAIHAVAALVGPAVRARLDALALSRNAHRTAPEILGASPAIVAVRESIARASLTTFPVLIEGESGTGKELVARAVHRLSARRDRPFAAVNCAALTDDLMEAELFGHARGAFTGAMGTRTGLFEWAHGGTLFLDEVGELSPRGQAKLLRALQEREIRRVGENAPRAVDVRVVAATNVALAEAAVHGSFRHDLLFRLAVIRIRVPPLRDRVEDIALLARAFWRQLGGDRVGRAQLGPDALAALCRHAWPGNVRELQNAVASLVVLAPTHGRVTERHVKQVLAAAEPAAPETGGEVGVSLTAARKAAERRAVTSALVRHGGRRSAAATELGLSRQGLTKALRRLGLSASRPKAGVA